MKILSVALLLVASMAFVMLGCSDNPGPVASTIGQNVPQAFPAGLAKEGVLHSATGGGHVFVCYEKYPFPYNGLITFSAIQHADGRFSGAMEHHDFEYNGRFQGKIVDLKVEDVEGGKMAKLSWEVTHIKNPEGYVGPPFKYGFLVVQDNGKGEGDFHTGLIMIPETGPAQALINMTPAQLIAMQKFYGAYGEWVRQHGNFTIR